MLLKIHRMLVRMIPVGSASFQSVFLESVAQQV